MDGWTEQAIEWLWSYLKDRKQKVAMSRQLQSEMTINRGCPQGSRIKVESAPVSGPDVRSQSTQEADAVITFTYITLQCSYNWKPQ